MSADSAACNHVDDDGGNECDENEVGSHAEGVGKGRRCQGVVVQWCSGVVVQWCMGAVLGDVGDVGAVLIGVWVDRVNW